jgi:hypothetical protein
LAPAAGVSTGFSQSECWQAALGRVVPARQLTQALAAEAQALLSRR